MNTKNNARVLPLTRSLFVDGPKGNKHRKWEIGHAPSPKNDAIDDEKQRVEKASNHNIGGW